MKKKKEQEPIITECNNCGAQVPIEETLSCEVCTATLCPDCICEQCEREKE